LVNKNKDILGLLTHQGPVYALLQAAESGATSPWGSISLPVYDATMKLKLSPEKQAAARNILQIMSELNQTVMRAGKDIYGPQISVFDAQKMAEPGFKNTDPASFIMYLASKQKITNEYLGKMADAKEQYFEENPKATTASFFTNKNSPYREIVAQYHAVYRTLIDKSPYR
jgi:hypothetical protein